jgi:tetratricopeptide (TPR) repeat protein
MSPRLTTVATACVQITAFWCLLSAGVFAAGTDDGGGKVVEIPLPDLAGLEAVVKDQITEGRRDVARIAGDPQSTTELKAVALGRLGYLYHTYGFLDAAAGAYTIAALLDGGAFQWNYSVAFVAQEQKDFQRALKYYLRAHAGATTTNLVYLVNLRIGESYQSLNDFENAGRAYSKALSLNHQGIAVLARLGELYLVRKEYQKAVEHLVRALALQPSVNKLHYPLAMAYRGLGDRDLAMHHLSMRGSVDIQPADPLKQKLESLLRGHRGHIHDGRTAVSAERYADAAQSFTRALDQDPANTGVWIQLADANIRMNKSADGLANLEEALRLEPENPSAHYIMGNLLVSLGESGKAIPHLEMYARTKQHDAGLAATLARAYRSDNKIKQAVESYERSVNLDHTRAATWLELISMLEDLADYKLAVDMNARAAERLPEDEEILARLAHSLAASPDRDARDGGRAMDVSRRLFGMAPDYFTARLVALSHAEANQCAAAVKWIDRAVEMARASGQNEKTLRDLLRNREHLAGNDPCRLP